MKLIEALKKIKDLQRKVEDLTKKIRDHAAIQTPMMQAAYPDQKGQIDKWLQSVRDLLKEILRLRIAIQTTNLQTEVTIELRGTHVTKTIAEWIHIRRDLSKIEFEAWNALREKLPADPRNRYSEAPRDGIIGHIEDPQTGKPVPVKIERFFDINVRDEMLDFLKSEPSQIDARLEIANAVTDLVE